MIIYLGVITLAIISSAKKFPIKLAAICVIIFAVISTTLIGVVVSRDVKHISIENNVKIIINEGWGINMISYRLHEENIIKHPKVFGLMAKVRGMDTAVQPGWLEIRQGMSYNDILDELVKPDRANIKVVIPEGYEIRQIADTLEEAGLIDREKFYEELDPAKYDYEFLKDLPERENPLEGYLFPATYSFSEMMSEHEIIDEMLSVFNDNFTGEFYARAKSLNMSVDQILTLASVIEREAVGNVDRKKIAGVFYNRLEQGIKLQSCATVQYILKERKEKLSTNDTKINSPYNTYLYEGLPIGPIASPGVDCIRAALYPEDTDALYFVLGSDGNHVFSATYEEHLAAKEAAESGN